MNERRLGPYVLEGELGVGAMGAVYRGRHVEFDVTYAIKVMHADLCAGRDAQRFQRELQSMAAVSKHPNVVSIHGAGYEGGRLFCVMDLVEGGDLQERIDRGPIPVREAARIARDVARAVGALHERGIIHRDIKPGNVLLDSDGAPRLTDFGLARLFADDRSRLTLTGELMGTPAYMAPEQALGSTNVGPGADVYALGALLYVLISGQAPVSGTSTLTLLSKVAQGELVPLGDVAPEAPDAIAKLCEGAMAFERDQRMGAAAFADALDAFLGEERAGRTAGAVVKERALIRWLALLCVIALLIGGTVGGVLFFRGVAARDAALSQRAEEWLAKGDALLGAEGEPEAGDLVALAGLEGELAAADHPELAASVEGLSAEFALRLGADEPARSWLKALKASPAKALPPRLRAEKSVLEAALAVAEGERGGAMALRHDLERAKRSLPQHARLRALSARLALLAGRIEEAQSDVRSLGDAAPASLRFAVAMASEDWGAAEALSGEVDDPLLLARLHLHLGDELRERIANLNSAGRELEAIRRHFQQAAAIPATDPLKASIGRSIRDRCRDLLRSAAKVAGSGFSDAEGKELVKLMVEVVGFQLALRELEPSAVLTKDELDTINDVCLPLVEQFELGFLASLLRLDPERAIYRTTYTLMALRKPKVDYEAALPVFREIERRVDDRQELAMVYHHYSKILLASERLDEFEALLERVDAAFGASEPALVNDVRGRYAELLRREGRYEEALTQFDQCLRGGTGALEWRGNRFRVLDALYARDGKRAHLALALNGGWSLLEADSRAIPNFGPQLAFVVDRVSIYEDAEGRVELALAALKVFLDGGWEGQPHLEARRIRLLLSRADDADRDRALKVSLDSLEGRLAFDPRITEAGGTALKRVRAQVRELRRYAKDRDWEGFAMLLGRIEGYFR